MLSNIIGILLRGNGLVFGEPKSTARENIEENGVDGSFWIKDNI
jgi:hypothetical protein